MKLAAAISLVFCLAGCAVPPPVAVAKSPSPPAITSVRVVDGAVDGGPWLAADASRATAAGAGPLRMVGAAVVAEGDRVGAFVEIPERECLLAFTHPSPTIIDVDLFAYADDGTAFATDESPEPQAAILACPPHPTRLYVVARVMAGSGVMGVGVQSVPKTAADAVARVMGVRGRPGEDSGRLDGWPGLEGKIRAHRDSLGGRWSDVRRMIVPANPRAATRISAVVDENRCLSVFATPSDDISSLELVAEDVDARIIGRARDQGKDRSLVLCAAQTITVTLALRPRGPQGVIAVNLARSGVGAEPEITDRARIVHVSQTLEIEAARKALAVTLEGMGYSPPRPVAAGVARIGARSALPLEVPPGCARIDVIVGKPFLGGSAMLWDDKGALLASARGGAGLVLFPCGRGGTARLDLEALDSPGPFAVEIRKDLAAPSPLVAYPLAAGRLLDRMNAAAAGSAAAAATATVVALDETSLKILPLPVPPGQCIEVIVALEAGGTGIDLRLVDGAGEASLTRARYVVSDHVCSAKGGRPASIELRLLGGRANAMVLTR